MLASLCDMDPELQKALDEAKARRHRAGIEGNTVTIEAPSAAAATAVEKRSAGHFFVF